MPAQSAGIPIRRRITIITIKITIAITITSQIRSLHSYLLCPPLHLISAYVWMTEMLLEMLVVRKVKGKKITRKSANLEEEFVDWLVLSVF